MSSNVKSVPTNADGSQSWRCEFCGELLTYPQPISLEEMCEQLGAFIEQHEHTTMKPCAAEELVGTEKKVTYGRADKRRTVAGIVQAWRYGTATIEMMHPPENGSPRYCWPSFHIKIKPNDGSRAVWVGPFKDSNNRRLSEIFSDDEVVPATV